MTLTISPITAGFVREILSWRYEPPYNVYDLAIAPEKVDDELAYFLATENQFHQIERDGEPIAGVSFGPDGRVSGGDYSIDALDIGMGVRPDLTGKGLGGEIVQAVIDFAIARYDPPALRVTIAAFNSRAIRVWTRAGFSEVSRFVAPHNGSEFVIMMRPSR